jgi:hypothetical protein
MSSLNDDAGHRERRQRPRNNPVGNVNRDHSPAPQSILR